MELRSYGAIIWRHIWIIVLIMCVAGAYVGYQYYVLLKTPGALKAYHSDVTLRIGLQGLNNTTDRNYADYITASDALTEELISGPILTSRSFEAQVVEQIQADMSQVTQRFGNADLGPWNSPGAISSALVATGSHNLVNVSVTWSTPAGAWAIAQAVGEVSEAHMSTYLDYEVRSTTPPSTNLQPVASAKVISGATDPSQVAGTSANKPSLLLVLLLVALIIGIALAFLVDYLDDRVRGKDEVEQLLQLPIYAQIPRAPTIGQNKSRNTAA